MGKIAITWKKSTIGFAARQRRVIESLGLRRLNHTVEHEDTPSVRGMVRKVEHLLEVREVEAAPARRRRSAKTEEKNEE